MKTTFIFWASALLIISECGKNNPNPADIFSGVSYIQEDELLEVTRKTLRLRKRILDPIARKRAKPEVMA